MRIIKEAYTKEEVKQRVADTRNIIEALKDSLSILQSALSDIGDTDSARSARLIFIDVDDISTDFSDSFNEYLNDSEDEEEVDIDIEEEGLYNENMINEDTVKTSDGKWTNKGDTGETHGKFKTKKEADAQRKAMFANGFKESLDINFGDDELNRKAQELYDKGIVTKNQLLWSLRKDDIENLYNTRIKHVSR